jgi:hypothetical protein
MMWQQPYDKKLLKGPDLIWIVYRMRRQDRPSSSLLNTNSAAMLTGVNATLSRNIFTRTACAFVGASGDTYLQHK